MFDTKKCTEEFGVFELGVREKIFCELADISDGFWKLVWDLGYPQNQTEWSNDAWIDLYAAKRKEVTIFAFSEPLKTIFKEFWSKNRHFWWILKIKFLTKLPFPYV